MARGGPDGGQRRRERRTGRRRAGSTDASAPVAIPRGALVGLRAGAAQRHLRRDERHAGRHVAADALLELVAGHRLQGVDAGPAGVGIVADPPLGLGRVTISAMRKEMADWLSVTHCGLGLARQLAGAATLEVLRAQRLGVLLRKVLDRNAGSSRRRIRPATRCQSTRASSSPRGSPICARFPVSASRRRDAEHHRAAVERGGIDRPARARCSSPMHQTESSALRAQVKKRPARTSIQPAVGSARSMSGSASRSRAPPI